MANLRQPVVLRNSMEDWNLTLCSSRWEAVLQPECGMTTVLVSVVRASRMMVIFTASHEERFHRTPVQSESREILKMFQHCSATFACQKLLLNLQYIAS